MKTLQSCLGAPCYLSGLSDIEHKHYTNMFHQKQSPDISAKLEVIRATQEKLKQAHPVILNELEKAVGANRHEIRRLREANSAAAEALVLKDLLGQVE